MGRIVFSGGRASGVAFPPPSKSYTHRAIVIAALSGGYCRIYNALDSADTRATIGAVEAMGAKCSWNRGFLSVESDDLHAPEEPICVGNSGTTLRFISAVLACFDRECIITGDESVRSRPMEPLLEMMRRGGVKCESDHGHAPLKIKGPITESEMAIDGSISSQFVSAAMINAPLFGRRAVLHVTGDKVSRHYIGLTMDMMAKFGADIRPEGDAYIIEPKKYVPADVVIPADYSSAAYPLVAGGLAGRVLVRGIDPNDKQGDRNIIKILVCSGCIVEQNGNELLCEKSDFHNAFDIDMHDMPDLFPVVAVFMSTAKGTCKMYGAKHLRYKETDRIATTVAMLKGLGASIEATEDGCVIEGVPMLNGGFVDAHKDHRIFMAAAVASLIADGPIELDNDECWNVSYPNFPEDMEALGVRVERRPRRRSIANSAGLSGESPTFPCLGSRP